MLAVSDVLERFERTPPGETAAATVTVVGRIVNQRKAGRSHFLDLQDGSGKIQLLAGDPFTDGLDDLLQATSIEATGQVLRTKRGELSVRVLQWKHL